MHSVVIMQYFWSLLRYSLTLTFVLILLAPSGSSGPTMAAATMHHHMIAMFRKIQETMLRSSMDRAQLNYGVFFKCRTTSNMDAGNEANFMLHLGDMRGFRRLNPRRKLALFLHGWNDEGSKNWVQDLLKTWIRFDPNYNVCVVDWGHLSQVDYKSASMSIFDVGVTVAGVILALEALRPGQFSRHNVTLAGYSLGAHAAGHAGNVLNGEVEQIIGLDPAGPLFTMPAVVSEQFRLDPSDAKFVQVLHTSGGALGSTTKSGHADFFPNGGTSPQSNCRMFMNLPDVQNTNPFACSHSTAAVFFKHSMDPDYPFVGHHCNSYFSYSLGLCDQNHRGRFGIHSRRLSYGDFYFSTESFAPYVKRQNYDAKSLQIEPYLGWKRLA